MLMLCFIEFRDNRHFLTSFKNWLTSRVIHSPQMIMIYVEIKLMSVNSIKSISFKFFAAKKNIFKHYNYT